jgi:hypothetical protein
VFSSALCGKGGSDEAVIGQSGVNAGQIFQALEGTATISEISADLRWLHHQIDKTLLNHVL